MRGRIAASICTLLLIMHAVASKAEVTSTVEHDDIQVQITPGVYFKSMSQAIMYEGTIPLAYTIPWQQNMDGMERQNLAESMCAVNKGENFCTLAKWLDKVDIQISNEINRATSVFDVQNKVNRVPRALDFIGNFMSWCCGVATTSDFKSLYSDNNRIKNRMESIRDNIYEGHRNLMDLTDSVTNYSQQIDDSIQYLQKEFGTLNLNFKQFKSFRELSWMNILHFSVDAAERNARRLFQTIHLIKRNEIINDCREKKIPANIIPNSVFYSDLQILKQKLLKNNHELSIPMHEISWYYKLEIAECEISNDKIVVRIKVPIQKVGRNWELLQFIPTPFKWHNTTCMVEHEATLLAVSGTTIRPITGELLKECRPLVNGLCYIPRYSSDVLSGPLCAASMHKGVTIDKLNQYCVYRCVSGNAQLITQVNEFTFIITHPSRNMEIRCGDKITKINPKYSSEPGALEIFLPCLCELYSDNKLKISPVYPCDKAADIDISMTHILPSAWSKIASLKIGYKTQYTKYNFANLSEIVNDKWEFHVPHFKIEKRMENPFIHTESQITMDTNENNLKHVLLTIVILWLFIITGFLLWLTVKNICILKIPMFKKPVKIEKKEEIELEAKNITINLNKILSTTECENNKVEVENSAVEST